MPDIDRWSPHLYSQLNTNTDTQITTLTPIPTSKLGLDLISDYFHPLSTRVKGREKLSQLRKIMRLENWLSSSTLAEDLGLVPRTHVVVHNHM